MNYSHVITSSGKCLQLGNVLGKGGEATIFHINNDDTIAVKIYTDGKERSREAKLKAMVADQLNKLTSVVAFPLETVSVDGFFVGFTMRKAVGAKPMHQLCSPGDRKVEFPDANFLFMLRVALNFARAIATIQSLGAVIGDINESGALVDRKGLVTIIDADSFQYRSAGKTFRCIVGKPEYTPPELRGQLLGNIDRTFNHDAFGVAVVIFEILFMGRHPFSGIYRGAGEPPTIAKAIEEGRFAYSPQKSQTLMEPPPHAPLLADIPMEVASAFQRAFATSLSTANPRPSANEWVSILERMEAGIIECVANPAHYYSRSAQSCPWCRFERGTGKVLFVQHQMVGQTTFNLDEVLARLGRIQGPGPAPDLLSIMPRLEGVGVSQIARDYRRRRRMKRAGGLAIGALAICIMISGAGWGFFLLIPAGLCFGEVSGAAAVRQQHANARSAWESALESWNRNAGSRNFDEKKAQLLQAAASYRALPGKERDKLKELDGKRLEFQKRKFLEAQRIGRAKIDGIGDSRKVTLRSFGIETAWDINARAIQAVPGFGSVLTGKLTSWRRSVESAFRPNPNAPTDPAEIARVRNEIVMLRSALETAFIQGIRELEVAKAEALTCRRDATRYQPAYSQFQQAEVDAGLL